jgi:hypothetical protein
MLPATRLIALAATALVGGCGVPQAPTVMPAAYSQESGQLKKANSDATQLTPALLYVSNVSNDTLTLYAFPGGKLVGTARTSEWPEGECVDGSGSVWVADDGAALLSKYPHGSTKRSATLQDPGNYPYGCAVDAKSGDLAVANIADTGADPVGDLTVYRGAKGAPTTYYNAKLYRYFYCAYDATDDLFVDGVARDGSFQLAELPKGKAQLTNIALDQSIGSPGNVEWDGKHVAIGDASQGVIYQISISGSTATVVGTTELQKAGNAGQFFIYGTEVVAGVTGKNEFGLWKYPAGGTALKYLKLKATDGAYGVVVSK